jgi:DNA-binding NarL/FixJ family response regulator
MIQVGLIDDHVSFRDALAFMLQREPDITVDLEAGLVAEARQLLETTPIDVALVDLDLPDGKGLEVLPYVRSKNPAAAAIVLTGSINPESPALAISNGAVGFLHKSASTADVVAAIRVAASGEMLFSATEAVTLLREAARLHARDESKRRTLDQLTQRERDVLCALGSGLDNQAIADQLFIGTATVRTHVSEVLRKLEVDSRLQAALLAVRFGLVDLTDAG